ncbi:type IVB secretion system protein IcmH/DotU [Tateyamaria sp. ANG-S1]|uniref:type IVB secretion system protein IcmH/DotU n=1 Tax=Tateyamaria sp. ANG-S1 TaxID=1577905 RepID=UPI00057DAF64|nr:type IVB secretion system protein IcmH/DotU [Tateyamaria sp. ANG-S1]KIC47763.1 hypothetical protein RA29_19335 [Tateyamaria sp. ANG-S1]
MSRDEDDRTVFGKALPHRAPPAPSSPAPDTETAQDEFDDVTILSRRSERSQPAVQERVSLDRVIEHAAPLHGKATNVLLSCAQNILGLLGLLRAGRLEMETNALRSHLKVALDQFHSQARAYRIPQDEITDAAYALAATCDDVAQNLPGSDVQFWRTHGLTAELFGDPNPGIGFFTRLHRLSRDPSASTGPLEVMFACLALGFEGQYRTAPDGPTALIALRADLYRRIRSIVPRPRLTLSRQWLPVIPRGASRNTRMPLWGITGVAAAMLVALYAALAWTMTQDAQAAQRAILDLHDPSPVLEIERTGLPDAPIEEVQVYEAPQTGQLERLQGKLGEDVRAGQTSITETGDFLVFRLGPALEFSGGAADLQQESPVIARIAQVLEAEKGEVIIEGHSDNIPLSGRGRYKTNEELSAARAAAVRDVLAQYLSDPTRMRVVGAGASKPLDRANTAEARSRNRRVDILLRKEERL